VLEQGLLSYTTMTKEILRVKLCGDIAIVTGRGQNTGTWQGQPMEADEWITDVYQRENGKWLCFSSFSTCEKVTSIKTPIAHSFLFHKYLSGC
jgi:ketosteroid isomerase-like protein